VLGPSSHNAPAEDASISGIYLEPIHDSRSAARGDRSPEGSPYQQGSADCHPGRLNRAPLLSLLPRLPQHQGLGAFFWGRDNLAGYSN
jgi:hypothetical protein